MKNVRFRIATWLIIQLDLLAALIGHEGPLASAIAKLGGDQR